MLKSKVGQVRASAAWVAGVALSATALASCTDVREPTTVIPSRIIAPLLNRSSAINTEVPRFPEPAEFIPELPVSDLETFRDLSDVELIESVRRANGVVSIGLKPLVAARTAQSGKLPAMTRGEVLAARATLEQHGARVVRTFRNLAALVAEIAPEAAPALRRLPVVNYLSAVSRGHLLGARAPAFAPPPAQDTGWGVRKIGAPVAWMLGERGQQSSVTILDSGLDSTHINSGDGPAGNINCRYVVSNTCHWVAHAHGVFVAGGIAAKDNAQGVIGVANQLANFASINPLPV